MAGRPTGRRRAERARDGAPRGRVVVAALALLACGGASPAVTRAQALPPAPSPADLPDGPRPGEPGWVPPHERLPGELEGVGITPRPDAALPLDAPFRDEAGQPVVLGDYFGRGRPVLVVLAYYRCPMLCGLVFQAAVDGLKPLPYLPGQEYELVVASIDARETPALAEGKKEHVLAALGKTAEAAAGVHFLTGPQPSIDRLAGALGFAFRYVPEQDDFAHAAGIFVATPDGRLSRTLSGLAYDPETLRLSIVEASAGKVGSVLDQIVLYCFHYDPKTGRYTPVVMNIMRLGAGLTVLLLGTLVGTLLWRERRATAHAAAAAAQVSPTDPATSSHHASTLGTP